MAAFSSKAERWAAIEALSEKRILVLDGAMGTEIQLRRLDEPDFRGDRFGDHAVSLKGNNDLLNLTRPDIIEAIHGDYLDAGADILETNTFSATQIAQADYHLQPVAAEIASEGARLARAAADARETPERPILVLGAMGPTNVSLSLSPDVNDPGFRAKGFDEVRDAYAEQADAMADTVDAFLVETVFDTLTAKAALTALLERQERTGMRVPILISGTITDASGRTLSGQTTEAFWNAVRHAEPWAIGLNCALGARELRQYVAELSRIADRRVLAYPNAGLPNAFGEYDETPDETAAHLAEWAGSGLVNIVGGCCGTTPAHIRAIAQAVASAPPRRAPERPTVMRLSGLEPFDLA